MCWCWGWCRCWCWGWCLGPGERPTKEEAPPPPTPPPAPPSPVKVGSGGPSRPVTSRVTRGAGMSTGSGFRLSGTPVTAPPGSDPGSRSGLGGGGSTGLSPPFVSGAPDGRGGGGGGGGGGRERGGGGGRCGGEAGGGIESKHPGKMERQNVSAWATPARRPDRSPRFPRRPRGGGKGTRVYVRSGVTMSKAVRRPAALRLW